MKTLVHRAESRGYADHGWLKSYHSFSFAGYYDPERIHYGALRVLNDDTIAGGAGFATHPHDNMEIISIPLEGDLEHKDSMGNTAIIKEGEIQVMSAGTGIKHSEKNKNGNRICKFLQIWVFPREKNIEPRYDQIKISDLSRENELYQILSPDQNDKGVWIHQDAWFHMGNLKEGKTVKYNLKGKNSGVYLFVLNGKLEAESIILERRDGLGISETESFGLKSLGESRVLLMEVPMNIK